jgi:hypothetical protein
LVRLVLSTQPCDEFERRLRYLVYEANKLSTEEKKKKKKK